MTATEPAGSALERPARRDVAWRALLRKPFALAPLCFLALVVAAAIAAPLLAPYTATATDLDHVRSGPSALHLLGTDTLGRDVLSRLMFGGRVSLVGVAEAVVTVLVLGVSVGLFAGYHGGWVDRAVGWVTDLALAIPAIVTLLVVLAVVGTNETAAMVTFGVLGAPSVARVVRGATLTVRQELYISAARVAGLTNGHIIFRHVLPRVAGPIIVQAALFAGTALLAETGLGYLGVGVQPPTPSWGGMVAEASTVIDRQPWLLVPCGLTIGLTILAFGLLGDSVRDLTADRTTRGGKRGRQRPRNTGNPFTAEESGALLSLRGLTITVPAGEGEAPAVEGADVEVRAGECVGLVGESGCGKTITAKAVLGLLPPGTELTAGHIFFGGIDLTTLRTAELRRLRGREIGFISQDPVASLDPVFSIGHQLDEVIRVHHRCTQREARRRALGLLEVVNLRDPELVARQYAHEISGGMAQRVGIAMALAGEPALLIADEPTTALDVTVQAEILALLRGLRKSRNMAVLMISHDWGVVAESCDRAYVMYAGHIVESAPVSELYEHPRHPYTAGLLDCIPEGSHSDRLLQAIPGVVPPPGRRAHGCHFEPRCALATADCSAAPVPFVSVAPDHDSRCLRSGLVARGEARENSDALA